jgi:hypothetical protein
MAKPKAHPVPSNSPNHRAYIREASPEMAAEYDIPLMVGVETKVTLSKQGKATTDSTDSKPRSEY